MLDTVYTHSESSYKGREHWYVDKQLTNTTDGRWYKKCGAAIMNLIHLQFPKKAIRLLLKAMTSFKAYSAKR